MLKASRRYRAGLSLEFALVLPLILLILFSFLGAIYGIQEEMILAHALDQTAREIAFLLPLADLAEQFVDPASWIRDQIPDPRLAELAIQGLGDMAATVLASPFILMRLDYWAQAVSHSRHRSPPSGVRRMAVDFDPDRKSIWLCLSFELSNYLRTETRLVRARVPVWNAGLFRTEGEEGEDEEDDIWSLSNFERGQAFRRLFGGKLPQFYPVIAGWDGHEALAIKSMDWTAPTWSSSTAVKRKLDRFICDLAHFEGAGGEGPAPGSIQSRRLILVIPKNPVDWKTPGLLAQWRQEAASMGVFLDIREYGFSHSYETGD